MAKRLTDAQRAQRDLLERDFQKAYTKALASLGFKISHHYDSRFSDEGTRGFPDLTIVGHGHMWFDELKRETGEVSDAQKEWHRALGAAGCIVFVSRPSDWEHRLVYAERIAGREVAPGLRSFPTPPKKKKSKRRAASSPS